MSTHEQCPPPIRAAGLGGVAALVTGAALQLSAPGDAWDRAFSIFCLVLAGALVVTFTRGLGQGRPPRRADVVMCWAVALLALASGLQKHWPEGAAHKVVGLLAFVASVGALVVAVRQGNGAGRTTR